MLVLELFLAMVLLVVCGFPAGFYLTRNLRWSPMEKLCGSIGASYGLLYLVFGAIYVLTPVGVEIPRMWLAFVSVASLGLGFAVRRDFVRLLGSFRVRQAVAGFAFLLVWTLVVLAMIRNYSGADWYGDWLEHFQRSLFFLHHFPTSSPIILEYQVPARPPTMNLLAAFILGQTGDRFEVFQLIFSFLNLLMFLPCCLIMPALVGPRRTSVWPLVALFALNPVVMQNVTYTWTKAFTAFYVILALWFYLAARRKNDLLRMSVAFLAVSLGLLVHYSAAPYLLFLTLHYLLRVFPKRSRRWRELATIPLVCGLLLVTWFGWSIAVYGTHSTFGSNTSVYASPGTLTENVALMAPNIAYSIVPVVLRDRSLLDQFKNQGLLGAIRDKAFIFYQTNLIFSMGVIGGPLVLWLLYRFLNGRVLRGSERSFWVVMIPFCVIVGVASVDASGSLGEAHITLLSLEVLGLSLLASTFPLRRALLALVIAGCLIDFSFGILLHARIESVENFAQGPISPGLSGSAGKTTQPTLTPYSPSAIARNNWILKHQYAQLKEFSRSRGPVANTGQVQMQELFRDDEKYWHGWFFRNNGVISFLGDHIAGESGMGTTILTCLLLALAVGVAGLLMQMSSNTASEKWWRLALFRGIANTTPVSK
jgi:hypothetical protein